MRSVGRGLLAATVVAGLALAAADTVSAAEAASPVKTEILRFDVWAKTRKVGRMRLKVMTIGEVAILDTEFEAPMTVKGKRLDAGFETQLVYRGTATPAPQRGKVTTTLDGFKLMDGTVTFNETGASVAVKTEATGYADMQRQPFREAKKASGEQTVAAQMLLTHAALLYFGPRMLAKPGKIEKVTYVKFPGSAGFPGVVAFEADCVLTRCPQTLEGTSEFLLQQVYAGGNAVSLATVKVDRDGKILESTLPPAGLTIRPEGAGEEDESEKAAPAKK